MDPLSLLIGPGIQAGSGLLAYLASMPDRRRAEQLLEQAAGSLGSLSIPELEQINAEELGPSAFENIQANPEAIAAQREGLARLGELSKRGYGIEDLAAQTEALRRSGRQEQAGRQRILADAAARGQSGAGTTLAAMLANQQGAAERGADIGLQTGANAQRRMYEALLARNQAAANLRGQDFQEQAQKAQARDMIARYNADARRSATAQRNANTQWRYGAQRQQAADKLAGAQMQAGIYGNRADQLAGLISGVGSGVGQGFSAYGQQQRDDDRFNKLLASGAYGRGGY